MEYKRCFGCMELKKNSPICERCGYDERKYNAPHQLPEGTVLRGQYIVGRVLEQEGFSITYLGRDINLDIPVAIQEYYPVGMAMRDSNRSCVVSVVAGQLQSQFDKDREHFIWQARTRARLQTVPEAVQMMNCFLENNTAYAIMGYVEGITLKEHMRRRGGRLSATEIFQLLGPLMEALGQAHELGILHGGIWPENIILQPNGRARLIEFGAVGDESTLVVTQHGFAAIEQYQSKGQLGPWTDVYAMCATVYQLLTGLTPPNAVERIMGESDFQWEAAFALSANQLETLKKGLALSPGRRIRTMQELHRGFFREETEQEPMVMIGPDFPLYGCPRAELPEQQAQLTNRKVDVICYED